MRSKFVTGCRVDADTLAAFDGRLDCLCDERVHCPRLVMSGAGIGVPKTSCDESRSYRTGLRLSRSRPFRRLGREGSRPAGFRKDVPVRQPVRAAALDWRRVRRLLQINILGGLWPTTPTRPAMPAHPFALALSSDPSNGFHARDSIHPCITALHFSTMRAMWCKVRSCWFNCCSGMKSDTMLRHPISTLPPCSICANAVRCSVSLRRP